MVSYDEIGLRGLADEIGRLGEDDLGSIESDLMHQETALEDFLELVERWREHIKEAGALPLLPAGMFDSGLVTKVRETSRGFRYVASEASDEFAVAEPVVNRLVEQTRSVLQRVQKRLEIL